MAEKLLTKRGNFAMNPLQQLEGWRPRIALPDGERAVLQLGGERTELDPGVAVERRDGSRQPPPETSAPHQLGSGNTARCGPGLDLGFFGWRPPHRQARAARQASFGAPAGPGA